MTDSEIQLHIRLDVRTARRAGDLCVDVYMPELGSIRHCFV